MSSNYAAISYGDPLRDDCSRPNVATIADRSGAPGNSSGAPGYCPLNRVVSVYLNSGSDRAEGPDSKAARPIQDGGRANPGLLANLDIAYHYTTVVNRCAFAKAQCLGLLPAIDYIIRQRQRPSEISFDFLPAKVPKLAEVFEERRCLEHVGAYLNALSGAAEADPRMFRIEDTPKSPPPSPFQLRTGRFAVP
jgi:hypothetical protein